MSIYYVYAYLRKDGSPYYIGKGKNDRAFSKYHSIGVPPIERIWLIDTNLSESEAFNLEAFYIGLFGRKCDHTGILHNKTLGGEGASGFIHLPGAKAGANNSFYGKTHSEESRQKIGEKHRGKVGPWRGKSLSEETKHKISQKLTGRTFSITDEHKANIAQSKKKQIVVDGMRFESMSSAAEHFGVSPSVITNWKNKGRVVLVK